MEWEEASGGEVAAEKEEREAAAEAEVAAARRAKGRVGGSWRLQLWRRLAERGEHAVFGGCARGVLGWIWVSFGGQG